MFQYYIRLLVFDSTKKLALVFPSTVYYTAVKDFLCSHNEERHHIITANGGSVSALFNF